MYGISSRKPGSRPGEPGFHAAGGRRRRVDARPVHRQLVFAGASCKDGTSRCPHGASAKSRIVQAGLVVHSLRQLPTLPSRGVARQAGRRLSCQTCVPCMARIQSGESPDTRYSQSRRLAKGQVRRREARSNRPCSQGILKSHTTFCGSPWACRANGFAPKRSHNEPFGPVTLNSQAILASLDGICF